MQNALFTYRRRVVIEGVETFNDNYLNPMMVGRFYWQTDVDNKRTLAVFINPEHVVTLGEAVGSRFVNHMEDFLRYLLAAGVASQVNTGTFQQQKREIKPRRIHTDVVDEDIPAAETAAWQS